MGYFWEVGLYICPELLLLLVTHQDDSTEAHLSRDIPYWYSGKEVGKNILLSSHQLADWGPVLSLQDQYCVSLHLMLLGVLMLRNSYVLFTWILHILEHNLILVGLPCIQPELDLPQHCLRHIWDLPLLHDHKIMVFYPYPFLVVMNQLFFWIIFINYFICIITGSPG